MKREINICTYNSLGKVPGIDRKLAIRIMVNRTYSSIEELRNVRGIGEKRYAALKNNFWCITEKGN